MREGEGERRERKGVSLLQLSPFFASIFPLFPQKRLILRLTNRKKANTQQRGQILIKLRVAIIIWVSAASSPGSSTPGTMSLHVRLRPASTLFSGSCSRLGWYNFHIIKSYFRR